MEDPRPEKTSVNILYLLSRLIYNLLKVASVLCVSRKFLQDDDIIGEVSHANESAVVVGNVTWMHTHSENTKRNTHVLRAVKISNNPSCSVAFLDQNKL